MGKGDWDKPPLRLGGYLGSPRSFEEVRKWPQSAPHESAFAIRAWSQGESTAFCPLWPLGLSEYG